jgi:hypothetical protein
MRELWMLQGANDVRILILPLYSPDDIEGGFPESNRKHERVIACAKDVGLEVIDTKGAVKARMGPTADDRKVVYSDLWLYPSNPHYSFAGGRFIAELVAPHIRIRRSH